MSALSFGSNHKEIKINLLPKDAFSQSVVGKSLDWALSTGRYIVVFTELVVILTFLQRFTLDRQLSDLNEEIFSRNAILESYARVETQARAIQNKGEFVQELEDEVDVLAVLSFLNNSTPSDVNFFDLNVNDSLVLIRGIAFSQSSLEEFVETLKTYPGLNDLLVNIISQEENTVGLEFDITLDFSSKEEER